MNEYETDSRRLSANADSEPARPAAELPRLDGGQSDSPNSGAAVQPELPVSAVQSEPPVSAVQSEPPVPAAQFEPPVPAAQAGQPYPVSYPPSPWQPTYPHIGAAPQPGGWTGAGYPGQPDLGGGPPPPPVWAQGYPGAAPPPRPSRLGRALAVGATALVLMLGSGVAGGVVALAVSHTHLGGRTYTAAPIINSADLPAIAAAVENSVVSISTDSGEGSGVVLTGDGYVLTNNHVVASAGGATVKVAFANGRSANAKIVGTDPRTDLAVVKAEGVSDLAAAKFGDSDAMQVGDTVLALGSPLGLQGSVTAGIISARDRTIQAGDDSHPGNPFQQRPTVNSISGLLQTDAPINPGNSGGALVNTRGEVIGINTAIATSGQSNGNIGVGFAIPSNKAKVVAEALRRGEKVSHPSLGVGVGNAENGGALVASVVPESPAAKVGLQKGDVIIRFGDRTINESTDLVVAVQAGKVGDRVELTYVRDGAEKTATVTLAETS